MIRAVSRAFYEGYIDGAESAVTVLEITRDVSFAVAGSIGAAAMTQRRCNESPVTEQEFLTIGKIVI